MNLMYSPLRVIVQTHTLLSGNRWNRSRAQLNLQLLRLKGTIASLKKKNQIELTWKLKILDLIFRLDTQVSRTGNAFANSQIVI